VRSTILKDVVEQSGNLLVFVTTILRHQGRDSNRVRDVGDTPVPLRTWPSWARAASPMASV
jgi:hypothetical protein